MAPDRPPLEEMTLRQLRRVASQYQVSRYSRMRKSELLQSIREAERSLGLAATAAPLSPLQSETLVKAQETVEAAKFDVGQRMPKAEELADVDAGLDELPGGYGDSRIVMLPRDPQWSYVYWDVPNDYKDSKRQQGGSQLALRLYDVTDIDFGRQSPHSMQEYPCDEMAREWYVPIPVSDRDYLVELGYRCTDGRWLGLVTSARIHIPPVYPSDWVEDHFITVNWDEDLRGKKVFELNPPKVSSEGSIASEGIYADIFGMAEGVEAMRVAGSLYGSMQQVPVSGMAPETISSYVLAAGSGMGMGMGMGLWGNMSGLTMSGAGIAASMPPARPPRKFWLIADAELIVYGATEPDATVTIGGEQIKLNPDGTFRFQMSFQDGVIDYPILAVAADGVQTRSIHMNFERETPSRNTNTKEEAVEELIP